MAILIFVLLDQVQIWDLSGQTASFFMNEKIKLPKDFQRQADQEVLLGEHLLSLSEADMA